MNRVQTSTENIVEAKDLTVAYSGQKVLEVPSLQVYRNEVLAVIGPNGSGKTTLLLCLSRLIKPLTGVVSYQGVPVLDSKSVLQLHRKLAVVFQESLLLNSTVWDNVILGLKLRGMKGPEVRKRAQKWLERFGIAALAGRQARTLSSGEAKRVSLARAFALQPEVLFLDEPFTALDGPTRQALLEDFESVLRETRVTTVMVTHDRNEALVLADRVAVMVKGYIRQVGTPAEVFSSPVDEEVAGFVEAGNILHGVVVAQSGGLASIKVGGQRIEAVSELTEGTRVILLLPHDDITVVLPSTATMTTSARNRLPGEVVRTFAIGSQVRVTIDCGFPLVALVTRRSAEELELKKGTRVYTTFKAVSIRVIKRH
jgi:tungstate transport system ATP-binding protein